MSLQTKRLLGFAAIVVSLTILSSFSEPQNPLRGIAGAFVPATIFALFGTILAFVFMTFIPSSAEEKEVVWAFVHYTSFGVSLLNETLQITNQTPFWFVPPILTTVLLVWVAALNLRRRKKSKLSS